MKASCEIIRDLLPLYVDEICSADSKALVEEHLSECQDCRVQCDEMRKKESACLAEKPEVKFTDGLKKLKNRVGKRTRIAILASVAAVIALFFAGEALLNMPLKELKPEDIHVTADVYNVSDLPVVQADDGESVVSIRKSEEDDSDLINVMIPDAQNVELSMTQNVMDEAECITVINWTSDFHIRRMTWRFGDEDKGIIYVDEISTSLLDNKAHPENRSACTIEMQKISKIVYLDDDGSETILWQADVQDSAAS